MTISFRLNGASVAPAVGPCRRLIDVLRSDLGLTGTKEGCGEGECGACTVLLDGRPVASCLVLAGQVEGRDVLTIEGLEAVDRFDVAGHLVRAGAVQCGFCIPGIALSAHALLAADPSPDRAAIARAVSGHLCRCTGYAGILAGIEAAAGIAPDGIAVAAAAGGPRRPVGAPHPRIDGLDRALGRTRFVDDLTEPGMLHAAAAYSAEVHGRIVSIDTSAAREAPGVVLVAVAADVPGENAIGAVRDDQPLLAVDRVRFAGDRVALVAAETREAARAAARLVRVSIDPLPALHDMEGALEAGAPAIHDGGNLCERHVLLRGDPEPALREADVLVDETWRTSWQEHVYLEPQGALAIPDADGGVTVRGSIQCPYHAREKVARVLGIPEDLVRVAPAAIGGGFGGKQDYPNEVAACAALLARLAGRPVKLVYDRSEDIRVTSKRHPFRIRTRLGARRDGTLLAARVDALADAGPYAAMSPVVLWRAFNAMAGPYRIPDVAVDAKAVHTNNPPTSAFRGFGHPQALFAHEGAMDELAARLGIDPLDLRERNILRRGDATAAGHVLHTDIRLAEVVASVRRRSNWAEARRAAEEHNARGGRFLRGLGVALLQFGCGLGALDEHLDRAEAVMRLAPDGAVEVRTGLVDMGQGSLTALAQIAAGALGIRLDRVRMLPPHTSEVGDCGPSAASRVTMVGGAAILDAAAKLRAMLGLGPLGSPTTDAVWDEAVASREPLEARGSMRTVYGPWEPATGQGEPFVAYTHAAHVAAVEVDTATGRVRVEKVWAAYDIGAVVNPSAAAAQIEGGVAQGVGYALLEDLHVRDGRALNADLSNYLVPTSLDVPEVDVEFVEGYSPPGPFGAKSLGEPAFVPAASAIVSAIRHATGLALREMPVTAERLFLHAGGRFGAARLTPPAVLLAAGCGVRMGGPKALLEVRGEPLVARIARALRDGGCEPVIVVVGAEAERVVAAVRGIGGVTPVRSPDPAGPMLASIQAGVAAAPSALQRGVTIQPVDSPRLAAPAVAALLAGIARSGEGGADALVAACGDRRGHPVWVSPDRIGDLLRAPPDHPDGLRGLMRAGGWTVRLVETGSPAVLDDADTPEDLE